MSDETPVNPLQEERDAIARIALTSDGLTLHRYLRRVLEAVIITQDSGALRDHNGRRTLARDLMAVMAEGIESNRGRSSADQPLLTRASGPVSVARAGGAGRRVALTPGDGWSPEPDPSTDGSDKA